MAKTAAMSLIELVVLREDVQTVLKYLGELGEFQFQEKFSSDENTQKENPDKAVFEKLQQARVSLDIPDLEKYTKPLLLPTEKDLDAAMNIVNHVNSLHERDVACAEEEKKASFAYSEALSFSNLKVSYSDLEALSFLTLRIGKIDPAKIPELKDKVGGRAIIVPLGDDPSRILAGCSKKARFALDGALKEVGFAELNIPKDFKGIPDDALDTLKKAKEDAAEAHKAVETERKNFSDTHKDELYRLLQAYSLGSQICSAENSLQSTEYVCRITGWVPSYLTHTIMKDLDNLTQSRTGIREFMPSEVRSVISGEEKVPVKVNHGKLVSNFERMIFSYGAPLYGTVDPTPFVALFFSILFGIMFGDAGQGLCFLIIGILCIFKKIKISGWEKFGGVFCCIGISSTIMGLLTGEFFANSTILKPFALWVTGFFGEPHAPILEMMPSSSPESISRMFMFFGFTIAVGFLINSCGIIINIINQFSLRKAGKAIFGNTGITGALFFWYVVVFAVRIAFFHHSPAVYDWIIIGVTLLLTAFSDVFARLVDGERPVFENGVFSAVVTAIVEMIELISSYLSNTVSFVRVGAFALAHAVLGYIINSLVAMTPGVGAVLVSIIGNAIVVVLEGMIVAIQVIRLQYYEFFSKFFSETGREFKPFSFEYKGIA